LFPLRKHGLSTKQFPGSAYVGSSKNLKDLKDRSEAARKTVFGMRDIKILTYRGTSLIIKRTPPRTAIGPYAYAYCRVVGGGVFL